MNPKIIKLINMLSERKQMQTFYVRTESYDLTTKKIVVSHCFEGFKNGQKTDEYNTENENDAITTLIRTIVSE